MSDNGGRAASRGRPRDAGRDRAIREAAVRLLGSTRYGQLTMTDIAREAGVGKPTVYLRWPSKAALVIDAMAVAMQRSPFPDSGDVRSDLVAGLRDMFRLLSTTVAGAALPGLLADLAADPELADLFERNYLEPRWSSLAAALERGMTRGELPEDLDVDLAIDTLFGPIYYRRFVRGEILRPADADRLVDVVLAAARCGALGRATRRRGRKGSAR